MPLKQEMWNNSVNRRTEFQRWIASASSRWTQQQNTTFLHCSAPEADWSLQHNYCHNYCFSSIYILEQTLSHHGTKTRTPFAASPGAHMTPEKEDRRQPPSQRLPAPRQHLGQQHPLGPGHPQPPVPIGEAGLGTGGFGGLGQGTAHSGPASARCSSFARLVPEERQVERALAARRSPTLYVLRSQSGGQSHCQLGEKWGSVRLPQSSCHVGCCSLLTVHSTEGKRHKW